MSKSSVYSTHRYQPSTPEIVASAPAIAHSPAMLGNRSVEKVSTTLVAAQPAEPPIDKWKQAAEPEEPHRQTTTRSRARWQKVDCDLSAHGGVQVGNEPPGTMGSVFPSKWLGHITKSMTAGTLLARPPRRLQRAQMVSVSGNTPLAGRRILMVPQTRIGVVRATSRRRLLQTIHAKDVLWLNRPSRRLSPVNLGPSQVRTGAVLTTIRYISPQPTSTAACLGLLVALEATIGARMIRLP